MVPLSTVHRIHNPNRRSDPALSTAFLRGFSICSACSSLDQLTLLCSFSTPLTGDQVSSSVPLLLRYALNPPSSPRLLQYDQSDNNPFRHRCLPLSVVSRHPTSTPVHRRIPIRPPASFNFGIKLQHHVTLFGPRLLKSSSKTSGSYISKPVQEFGVLYTLWFRNRFPGTLYPSLLQLCTILT